MPAKKPATTTNETTAKRKTTKKAVAKKPATKRTTTTRKTANARTKASNVMHAVEKQFDEGMTDTQKFLNKKVSKKTRKTIQSVAHRADSVASSVEHLAEEVESVTDSIFPSKGGSQGIYNAQYHKSISRLFIFRFLWLILQCPIVFIWSIWYAVVTMIHYLIMFIIGKRDKYLWNKQVRFWKHIVAWKSYLHALTDARPAIIHPPVK